MRAPHPSETDSSTSSATVASALAGALADACILYGKTRGVHWNVTGPLFFSAHQLTELHYLDLAQASDDLAERMRAIDEIAPSSYREFSALSGIDDEDSGTDAEAMIRQLTDDNRAASKRLSGFIRAAAQAGDEVSEDMLIARKTVHDKAVWMLGTLLR